MKNLRNQKGITLVALVVTIIVLLILAGVSLSLVAGSDGILKKADTAVSRTSKQSAIEQADLLIAEYKADYLEGKYTGEGTAYPSFDACLQAKIKTEGNDLSDGAKLTYSSGTLTVTLRGGVNTKATVTISGDDEGKVSSWETWSDGTSTPEGGNGE